MQYVDKDGIRADVIIGKEFTDEQGRTIVLVRIDGKRQRMEWTKFLKRFNSLVE